VINRFNESLWGDEGFSAILSMKDTLPEIIKTIVKDTSPPLWNIFEWAVFNTFGTEEIYIRGLSLIFFLGVVFFVYKIGKLVFSKKAGLLAAILTAFNPFFFIYAFEGRMYSIMALGVTASMYFFLKRSWKWYIFWTLWALYSHHFAMFALLTQGLWFLWEILFGNKKTAKAMFRAFLFVGVGYIPWVYPLYLQVSKVGGDFWLGVPTLDDLKKIFYNYLGEGTGHKYGRIASYSSLIVLFLRKWGGAFKKSFFLLTWFTLPILATWGISQTFQSIFFDRYLLYTIPGAMLLVASNKRKLTKYIVWGIVGLYAFISYQYFTHPTKLPFRDLATYVLETRVEGDFLINDDPGKHKLWESKYYNIPAPIYVPDSVELPFFVGTALMTPEDIINKIPEDVGRLGVITYKDADELEIEGFDGVVSQKRFGDLNFVWLSNLD